MVAAEGRTFSMAVVYAALEHYSESAGNLVTMRYDKVKRSAVEHSAYSLQD